MDITHPTTSLSHKRNRAIIDDPDEDWLYIFTQILFYEVIILAYNIILLYHSETVYYVEKILPEVSHI